MVRPADTHLHVQYTGTALLSSRLIVYMCFKIASLIKKVIHTPGLRVDSVLVTTAQNNAGFTAAYDLHWGCVSYFKTAVVAETTHMCIGDKSVHNNLST